ncbi:MAG: cell envelope integrity protein CreD [Dysgonamonadaceae bacterium]|jgi:inner membrane protein|nr:cell envelope integrity protein CreD [Dysgonamonadaceae bacterium]
MEIEKKEKFSQSFTFKAMIVGVLVLLMLIPQTMIQGLILEREQRSKETVAKINEKWSLEQTLCPPVLVIPYTQTGTNAEQKTYTQEHEWFLTPEKVAVDVRLIPIERHYGIYKAILYQSEITIDGHFAPDIPLTTESCTPNFNKAYLLLGMSDLRGITRKINFNFDGQTYDTQAASSQLFGAKCMKIELNNDWVKNPEGSYSFSCSMKLNGSGAIHFIPVAKTTQVSVVGDWPSPSFTGNFSPEYSCDNKGFQATWNVLEFNRNIPERWSDKFDNNLKGASFGVNLVETVDHYQQNMRSSKYALMFIALTFVIFYFVEVLTRKRIHPIQYLLVGTALILFYSLLLSFSEQTGFAWAYLIACVATVALIVSYVYSIFKNFTQTGILGLLLSGLYIFLYVVLQLEDLALIIGSVGLFIILGIIMFVSRKINWYKPEMVA